MGIFNVSTIGGFIVGTAVGTLIGTLASEFIKEIFFNQPRRLFSKQTIKGHDNIAIAQSNGTKVIKKEGDLKK